MPGWQNLVNALDLSRSDVEDGLTLISDGQGGGLKDIQCPKGRLGSNPNPGVTQLV